MLQDHELRLVTQSQTPGDCASLVDAIGDTPVSTIPLHYLLRGWATAYVAGPPATFAAAIVQSLLDPGEPAGFGANATAMWGLLRRMTGWACVNVEKDVAPALGTHIEAETHIPVRYYGDVQLLLQRPVVPFRNEAVRLLTLEDVALVEAAPRELRGGGWPTTRQMLEEGVASGAIMDGRLVAIAFTSALTPKHADIGINTSAGWRGRGFATAAASLVARQIQQAGLRPVWSTGEDNWASLRVAQKLGFTEVARRMYVIPAATPQPTGTSA
ncbi:MAG TPA: GNAT family N-acetyltransferase [Chloroflexota bacterium]|nr:GNAT family N-acetyltransferase [Chloroflexota bacterium]